MCDLISLILSRLDLDPPRLAQEELSAAPASQVAALLDGGILRPARSVENIDCWECGVGHVCHVTFITRARGAEPEGYIHCPECGILRVDKERLLRWEVNPEAVARMIGDSLGTGKHLTPLVPNLLWRIGRKRLGGREVLFLRRAGLSSREPLASQLSGRAQSLLLVANERARARVDTPSGQAVFALDEFLQLEGDELRLDTEVLDRCLATDLPVATADAARPSRKRANRAAKIELLEREMIEHLRAARDHASATGESGDGPRLLPRPTQRELGRRCGLSETDVSRCLHDPAAQRLLLYWKTALDLGQLLRWQTPRGNRSCA